MCWNIEDSELFEPIKKPCALRHKESAFEKRSCTRKVRFRDLEEAKGHIQRMDNMKGDALRIYHCEFCHGYHTTSKIHLKRVDLRNLTPEPKCSSFPRFVSKEAAERDVMNLNKLFGSNASSWHCHICGGYHIAKMALRLSKNVTPMQKTA
jgi:hypothetical protein